MLVRWDSVVQGNNFWSEGARPAPTHALAEVDRPVRVQVWLFGYLSEGMAKSPVTVECLAPFSVRQVVAELGRTLGPGFLERLTDTSGELLRHCRAFADGEPVDDTAAPIHTTAAQTDIELIVLTAAEGG